MAKISIGVVECEGGGLLREVTKEIGTRTCMTQSLAKFWATHDAWPSSGQPAPPIYDSLEECEASAKELAITYALTRSPALDNGRPETLDVIVYSVKNSSSDVRSENNSENLALMSDGEKICVLPQDL